MTFESTPTSSSLVSRVKGILMRPTTEWGIIEAEPATVKGLFTGYAMILAAIGPIASFIGGQVFGIGFGPRASLVGGLVSAIIAYVLALAGVWVLGLIIDALAPSFGGQKNRTQAMKVAVYASTAAWLVGIFSIHPLLSLLAILGLYSLYLLYLGLPRLMNAPTDKALGYTAVVVICAVVLWIVVLAVASMLAGAMVFGTMATSGAYAP